MSLTLFPAQEAQRLPHQFFEGWRLGRFGELQRLLNRTLGDGAWITEILQRRDRIGDHMQTVSRRYHTKNWRGVFLGESLADAGQHRHVAISPQDAFLAANGKLLIADIMAW